MSKEEKSKQTVVDTAFSKMAEEFSKHAEGAGASLGRTAKFLSGTLEVVLTSPLLIPQGYKKIVDVMKPKIDERVAKIPEGELVEPELAIAGPALEAMRFTVDEEEIANLFAELLAASMDARRKGRIHHSFVEIVKQLSPGEARVLKVLYEHTNWPVVHLQEVDSEKNIYIYILSNISNIGYEFGLDELGPVQVYLDNLCRLGLAEMPKANQLYVPNLYEEIENSDELSPYIEKVKSRGHKPIFERTEIRITQYGLAFCEICLPADKKSIEVKT